MKIKNSVIIALVQAGGLNLSANCLEARQAYEVIKFRRAVGKAYAALLEAERTIIDDCGVKTDGEGALSGSPEAMKKFALMRQELSDDLTDVGDVRAMSYDDWHKLKNENTWLRAAVLEDSLENVIWVAPEQ